MNEARPLPPRAPGTVITLHPSDRARLREVRLAKVPTARPGPGKPSRLAALAALAPARPLLAALFVGSGPRRPAQNFETAVSFAVMNSRRAGCPSRVARIPRSMAGAISPASTTRSP